MFQVQAGIKRTTATFQPLVSGHPYPRHIRPLNVAIYMPLHDTGKSQPLANI